MRAPTASNQSDRSGLILGIGSYLLWGLVPLYLSLLKPTGSVEIIAHRIIWSLVLCVGIIAVRRNWRELARMVRTPSIFRVLALSSVLITANWLVYVFAVVTGRVLDASLGYFINPLVTVLLAVVFLRERLRSMQWVALGVATLAVIVITIGYGQLPWIALCLAVSFGLYGYVKKRVGDRVPALEGLTVETAIMTPLSIGYLIWLQAMGQGHFLGYGGWHAAALVGTGVITAVPLLLFNASARRLPLSVVGMLQYIAPIAQFLVGVLVLGETMAPARWAGFALVWVSLIILTTDGLIAGRAQLAMERRGLNELRDAEESN